MDEKVEYDTISSVFATYDIVSHISKYYFHRNFIILNKTFWHVAKNIPHVLHIWRYRILNIKLYDDYREIFVQLHTPFPCCYIYDVLGFKNVTGLGLYMYDGQDYFYYESNYDKTLTNKIKNLHINAINYSGKLDILQHFKNVVNLKLLCNFNLNVDLNFTCDSVKKIYAKDLNSRWNVFFDVFPNVNEIHDVFNDDMILTINFSETNIKSYIVEAKTFSVKESFYAPTILSIKTLKLDIAVTANHAFNNCKKITILPAEHEKNIQHTAYVYFEAKILEELIIFETFSAYFVASSLKYLEIWCYGSDVNIAEFCKKYMLYNPKRCVVVVGKNFIPSWITLHIFKKHNVVVKRCCDF